MPRDEVTEMELDVVGGNANDCRCKGAEGSAEHAAASDEAEPDIPLGTRMTLWDQATREEA